MNIFNTGKKVYKLRLVVAKFNLFSRQNMYGTDARILHLLLEHVRPAQLHFLPRHLLLQGPRQNEAELVKDGQPFDDVDARSSSSHQQADSAETYREPGIHSIATLELHHDGPSSQLTLALSILAGSSKRCQPESHPCARHEVLETEMGARSGCREYQGKCWWTSSTWGGSTLRSHPGTASTRSSHGPSQT
eukprot:1240625-Rhodomonas_salina.2